jgi:hypothetical protein
MAEKRERNKTRGMMIGVAQKQASTMDYTKRPTSATAQQLQQELEMSDREVSYQKTFKIVNFMISCKASKIPYCYKNTPIISFNFQRHQQMQSFLSTSGSESLQRRRADQPGGMLEIILHFL